MTSFYRTTLPDGQTRLQEIVVGQMIELPDGIKRRVAAVTIAEATEDDPELGVEAGDMVTTIEFAPLDS